MGMISVTEHDLVGVEYLGAAAFLDFAADADVQLGNEDSQRLLKNGRGHNRLSPLFDFRHQEDTIQL